MGAALAARIARRFGPGRALIGSLLTGAASLIVPWRTALRCWRYSTGRFGVVIYSITERPAPEDRAQSPAGPRELGDAPASPAHPLGAPAGGALAQSIGVRAAVTAGAVGFLLSTICLLGAPVRMVD